jgi:hypothetical protein
VAELVQALDLAQVLPLDPARAERGDQVLVISLAMGDLTLGN